MWGRAGTALAAAVAACFSICSLTPAGTVAAAQPPTWNFQQAQVPAAQPPGNYGRGVLVAVVDTWVDFSHPEFGGRVVDEADCVGANGSPAACQDHAYHPDSCAHGTHVAGTIASTDFGVAPGADILAVQVLTASGSSCTGATSDVAAGIAFATAHGAKVINLSVGDLVPLIFQDQSITNAISAAASAGVVVVVAAGNSGLPFTDNYGSRAVMVAATGPGGTLAGYSDSFVVPAGAVAVAAPGGDSGSGQCSNSDCVLSTVPGGGTGLMEGTSMATPHVSGTAALLLAQNPTRGRSSVLQALTSTARPLSGAGSGLLDAAAALGTGAGPTPTTTRATTTPTAAGAPAPGPKPTVTTRVTGPTSSRAATTSTPEPGSVATLAPVAPTTGPPGTEPATTVAGGVAAGAAPGPPGGASPPLRGAPARSWAGRHAATLSAAAALVALVGAASTATALGAVRRRRSSWG